MFRVYMVWFIGFAAGLDAATIMRGEYVNVFLSDGDTSKLLYPLWMLVVLLLGSLPYPFIWKK